MTMTFSKSFGSYSISLPRMRSRGPSSNNDGVKAPHVTPRTGTCFRDRNRSIRNGDLREDVQRFNVAGERRRAVPYLRGRQAIGFHVPLAVFKANGQVSRIGERDASAE